MYLEIKIKPVYKAVFHSLNNDKVKKMNKILQKRGYPTELYTDPVDSYSHVSVPETLVKEATEVIQKKFE